MIWSHYTLQTLLIFNFLWTVSFSNTWTGFSEFINFNEILITQLVFENNYFDPKIIFESKKCEILLKFISSLKFYEI